MKYEELVVYQGGQTTCFYCKRPFQIGEVFNLADVGALAFCYSDEIGGCQREYFQFELKPQRELRGDPMIFREPRSARPVSAPGPPRTVKEFFRRALVGKGILGGRT